MNDSNIEETLVVSKETEEEPEVKDPKTLKKDGERLLYLTRL